MSSDDVRNRAWSLVAHLPDFNLDVQKTALLTIDLQYLQAHADYGFARRAIDAGLADDVQYLLDRLRETVVPNVRRLHEAARRAGVPVIHTRCVSLVGDGSDQTWRHRMFGLICSLDSVEAEFLPEVAPQPGDLVLNKTGSSAFNSTNLDHLLRTMKREYLIVTGIFTNSCCETTTRDAGDRDYRVYLVDDACAAISPVVHRNALAYLDHNFCMVRNTSEVLTELEAVSAARSASSSVTS